RLCARNHNEFNQLHRSFWHSRAANRASAKYR
ncbi:outer membrane protein, partial [Helicobacter pylori]